MLSELWREQSALTSDRPTCAGGHGLIVSMEIMEAIRHIQVDLDVYGPLTEDRQSDVLISQISAEKS